MLNAFLREKNPTLNVSNLQEIVKMIHWAGDRLKGFGATVEYCPLGMQTLPDGKQIELPPVLMGELGQDSEKKTVLLYGHLDVQPALKEDGWDYEPFVVSGVYMI